MIVNEIASKSRTLQEKVNGVDFWRNSLYESFFLMSSPKAKGSRGERLAAEVFETLGHDILRKKNGKLARLEGDADHDIVVDGYRTEVKLSLTWDSTPDQFTWQQIRSLQKYDRIIFIGLNPDEAKMWWATKEDLERNIFGKSCYRQHGGKKGNQELYWIRNEVPAWFRPVEEWK
jgi:hypothetical protein